jgi:L-2-hydroxyglutarate oxidase LhgO
MNCDVLIAGGGIVGMTIARSLLIQNPKLKLILVEKELQLGLHASGRNSGVLHAGFYYSPESLKARFCLEGNQLMRQFAVENRCKILQTGKVIVTKSESELDQLHQLYKRGIVNGVDLDLLPAAKLEEKEPFAKTTKEFIWSPTTAICNPREILKALELQIKSLGCEIILSQELKQIDDRVATVGNNEVHFRHLINATGGGALKVASQFEVGSEFTLLPFLGSYWATNQKNIPIRSLIYPVPHPINPFLGVHWTLTHDGYVKLGPTALPVLGPERYKASDPINFKEIVDSLKGLACVALGESTSILNIMSSEFMNLSKTHIVNAANKMVSKQVPTNLWKKKPSGIRAQLVENRSGTLVQDFIVKRAENSTHILNAVSPGWTSAFAFAEYISREFVLDQI